MRGSAPQSVSMFRRRMITLPRLALWFVLTSTPAFGVTLRELIIQNEELSSFRQALSALGLLETIMSDLTIQHTVFAPLNEAISASQFFNLYMQGLNEGPPPRWHLHLERAVKNHIVEGAALDKEAIFDGQQENIFTLEDPLHVDHLRELVDSAQIISQDIVADNGILHVVNKVMEPEFFRHSFSDLERQREYGPDWLDRVSLQTIVDFNDARGTYNKVEVIGQTHAGCRIRALNRIGLFYLRNTLNRSPDIKSGEFLNASNREETIYNFLEYTLVPKNYYRLDLAPKHQELIMAHNGCSHMWVSTVTGKVCFNNGCQVATPRPREYLANNGVGYVIDKCVVCAGVALLLEYAAYYSVYNFEDSSQFWETSGWNVRNLSMSVGDGRPVTLFAAVDAAWNVFNSDDVTRISTDKWKPHQQDFLRHSLVQGIYRYDDLVQLYNDKGGAYNLTSLAGQNLTFEYNYDTRKVIIYGEGESRGELWLTDIKGVDGYMHFTSALPVPKSVTHTVYDVALDWPDFTTQITLIDTVFLTQNMRRLLPLTALYAPNEVWENVVIELADISKSVLENMIFEDLRWCHELRAMVGERIESHNGQVWKISLNKETNMPCFDTEQVFGGPVFQSCVTECDILARNGIVHKVDKILLFEQPETTGPRPPTIPTQHNPSAPTFYRPPSPTPGTILPRDTFFGPINPAYVPDGSVFTASARETSQVVVAATTVLLAAALLFVY